MPETIERLREDHRRMRNVLAAAEQMASDYHLNHQDDADHLFCLLDYLSGYPDEVHHPTEDVVFARLPMQDLTPEERRKMEYIQTQHRTLQAATQEMSELFESLRDQFDVNRLLDALKQYAKKQLEHMEFEENEIFPITLEKIPSGVWDELDRQFGESKDPLFDQADRSYTALYQFLLHDPEIPADMSMSQAFLRFLSATSLARDEV